MQSAVKSKKPHLVHGVPNIKNVGVTSARPSVYARNHAYEYLDFSTQPFSKLSYCEKSVCDKTWYYDEQFCDTDIKFDEKECKHRIKWLNKVNGNSLE